MMKKILFFTAAIFIFFQNFALAETFLKGYVLESSEDAVFYSEKNHLYIKKPLFYNSTNTVSALSAFIILTEKGGQLSYLHLKDNVDVTYNGNRVQGNSLKYSKKINAFILESLKNDLVTVTTIDKSIIKTKKIEFSIDKMVAVLRGEVSYQGADAVYSLKSDNAVINLEQTSKGTAVKNIKAVGNVIVQNEDNTISGENAYFDSSNNLLEINGNEVNLKTKDGSTIKTCGVILDTLTRKNQVIPCDNVIKGIAN